MNQENPQLCNSVAVGDAGSEVVFRVPHKHPHRLKRPLHHSDDLAAFHFLLRPYKTSWANSDQEQERSEILVQRCQTDDIHCMELFGGAAADQADTLIRSLKQWCVDPALHVDEGQL